MDGKPPRDHRGVGWIRKVFLKKNHIKRQNQSYLVILQMNIYEYAYENMRTQTQLYNTFVLYPHMQSTKISYEIHINYCALAQ